MPRSRVDDTDGGGKGGHNKKRGNEQVQRNALFAGWINVTIPQSDRLLVDEFGTSTELTDALVSLLNAHHRLTLIWNVKEECFQANSFCMDETSANAGLMVSARSDDPIRALVKLVYIHDHLLPADYSSAGDERSNW